jgi:hypothetical protein
MNRYLVSKSFEFSQIHIFLGIFLYIQIHQLEIFYER